ncbi:Carbon storage regulator, CsrA [Pseudomonas sp. 8AS]|uniref:carbon storage regulator n=1 Tax=Pseudomonas sp. 8AS TaxID=2653163 RepID=UPI0012F1C7A6|nr:carbon storage regulator [Pseudomonas sp. 8AS]VXC18950.1 Carbon storage regulator, CsrA [Pseudomonas sp. 8AS]
MGNLCLTRRAGEQIRLTIDPAVDTDKLLRDGITVQMLEVDHGKVRLAIEAPNQVKILRAELVNDWPTVGGVILAD